jgi:hypothetical protein
MGWSVRAHESGRQGLIFLLSRSRALGFQQIAPLSNRAGAVSLCSNAICLKFAARLQSQRRECWDGSENCAFAGLVYAKALLARQRERFWRSRRATCCGRAWRVLGSSQRRGYVVCIRRLLVSRQRAAPWQSAPHNRFIDSMSRWNVTVPMAPTL